jgi:hypothetical protein
MNSEIDNLIEDIKGIVALLDPEGYKWAEETKKAREDRDEFKRVTSMAGGKTVTDG